LSSLSSSWSSWNLKEHHMCMQIEGVEKEWERMAGKKNRKNTVTR